MTDVVVEYDVERGEPSERPMTAAEVRQAEVDRLAAEQAPPAPPSVVQRIAEVEAELRGIKQRAAVEAARSTTTAKGVAAAIAATDGG